MSYLFNQSVLFTSNPTHNPPAGYAIVARFPSKSYAGMFETCDVQIVTLGFWCASRSYPQEVNICL